MDPQGPGVVTVREEMVCLNLDGHIIQETHSFLRAEMATGMS